MSSLTSLGKLYIVATPIGSLQDITFRAVEILKTVDKIAAEDTRHSRVLLQQFAISTPLLSLHNFNESSAAQKILRYLQAGENIALISDAGTPLISDPGYTLVREARQLGVEIVAVPGACAAIAALCVSGLPTDKFVFEGFLPSKAAERLGRLQTLAQEQRTLIFYEAPHRIMDTLDALVTAMGEKREAVIAKELTKIHERVIAGTLAEVRQWLIDHADAQRGEFVVMVAGAESLNENAVQVSAQQVLDILLAELPVKQAAGLASKITGVRKNELYERAVKNKE